MPRACIWLYSGGVFAGIMSVGFILPIKQQPLSHWINSTEQSKIQEIKLSSP